MKPMNCMDEILIPGLFLVFCRIDLESVSAVLLAQIVLSMCRTYLNESTAILHQDSYNASHTNQMRREA